MSKSLVAVDAPAAVALPKLQDGLPRLVKNQKLDLARVRYPGELVLFVFLCCFSGLIIAGILLFALQSRETFLTITGVVLLFWAINKLAFVYMYWHLYGNSIQVSESQFPEIYEAVQKACDYLDLRPCPSVFVLHGNGLLELFLIKRFSKRGILVFTSELVDALLASGDTRPFMMVVGRQLGHIKAGHFRWTLLTDIIGKLSIWFYFAYRRRCHYTADRVGLLVAGNVEASQFGLIALTVGKRLATAARITGVRQQDDELRDRFFARWVQLYAEYPYMIHRIVELLSFREFVLEQPMNPESRKAVAALPEDVSSYSIQNLTIIGPAVFGTGGSIVGGTK